MWIEGRGIWAEQKVNPVLAWADILVMVRRYDETDSARI